MGNRSTSEPCCPDCGRQLHNVWDYPANELWCVHCGNRYFASLGAPVDESSDSLYGFRVLLLDESAGRRDRVARRFTQLGYWVTPVCHARQALEAASFRRFDLVVLPAKMCEFDCHNLLCKLRRLLGDLKFVVFTEQAEEVPAVEDRLAEISNGCVSCTYACGSDCGELERTVERAVDELLAARVRQRGSLGEVEELLGTA